MCLSPSHVHITTQVQAIDMAVATAEDGRCAQAEVEAAELEIQALNEEAKKDGADRDAIAAQLKAARLRHELARQRAERAAKTLRNIRVGGSLVERGAVEAALAAESAVAAAQANRSADNDVEAAEREVKALEEEAADEVMIALLTASIFNVSLSHFASLQ